MDPITVLIEVHNEEKNIENCIISAKLLSKKILVIDMESTDKTVAIAKKNDARVISFGSLPQYVEPARGFGIKQVKTGWVMILDADERITVPLAKEIKKTISENIFTHYKVPRKNFFSGKKWLKHGGWWPDHQMRLLHTKAFVSWPSNIHSTPHIKGKMGYLNEPFLHYFHGDIESMVKKTLVFEDIESNLLYKAKRNVSVLIFFRKFFGELWRRCFQKAGYQDGDIGIIESIYQAFSKTITYLFLYEKSKKSSAL